MSSNTTVTQMKMFLTRLGFSSQMVVTGDPSQVDLGAHKKQVKRCIEKTRGLEDAKVITFDRMDVIRHPLVQRILERYENDES